jgi:hypothetical protein
MDASDFFKDFSLLARELLKIVPDRVKAVVNIILIGVTS